MNGLQSEGMQRGMDKEEGKSELAAEISESFFKCITQISTDHMTLLQYKIVCTLSMIRTKSDNLNRTIKQICSSRSS